MEGEDELQIPLGIHYRSGTYVQVKRSRTSGFLYGEEWIGNRWDYGGRKALAGLSSDTTLTAEQAGAFGHETGTCIFCGRELTDDRSLARGYGPVCAKQNELPWDDPDMANEKAYIRIELDQVEVAMLDDLRGDVSRPQWIRRAITERREREMEREMEIRALTTPL